MPATDRCACRLPGAATAPRRRRNPAIKLAPQSDPVAGRRLAGRWSAANSNAVSCASCAAPRLPWRAARHLPSMSTRTPTSAHPAMHRRPFRALWYARTDCEPPCRRHDRTFSEWEAGHCEAARYPARDAWTPLASGVPQLFVVGSEDRTLVGFDGMEQVLHDVGLDHYQLREVENSLWILALRAIEFTIVRRRNRRRCAGAPAAATTAALLGYLNHPSSCRWPALRAASWAGAIDRGVEPCNAAGP